MMTDESYRHSNFLMSRRKQPLSKTGRHPWIEFSSSCSRVRQFENYRAWLVLAVAAFGLVQPYPANAETVIKPSNEVLQAEQSRIAAIQKATRSTIGVFGTDGQGGGSGVIISADGYALTNFHVTDPFGDRMRCGLSNGEMVEAIIVGIDPTGDLALIKLDGRNDFPAANIADSDTVRAGQWCFAAGNPFVLATNLRPTVTWGIVSGVHRYQYPSGTILEYTDCIQTDAAINPGNSGGPLYNADGDLIGINGRCSFEKRGRVNVGVGYAISINQAMLFLGHLKSGRLVDHATLGFTVGNDGGKVVVTNILETSDAYRRGLRYGDQILKLDGREITSVNQLKNILGIFPTHSRLAIQFRQEGKVLDSWIRVSPLHLLDELLEIAGGKSDEAPPDHGEEKKEKDQAENEDKETNDAPDRLLETQYEKRRGFTNYHFNRRELERILAFSNRSENKPTSLREWIWTGKLIGETTKYSTVSRAQSIESKFGDEFSTIDQQRGWNELIKTKSYHAISLGLRLWERWTVDGPQKLGETTYIGTTRIIGHNQFVDLTQVTVGEVEVYFHTDPLNGRLLLIEIESDPKLDRLEVRFDRYESMAEREVPGLIQAGFGPEPRWQIELEKPEIKETGKAVNL
jgi:serine protease Do